MSHAWMPFYVADYLADTTHLSTLEHGAYLLLIMDYWQHGKLPGDPRRMARICRMQEKQWRDIRDNLAELFGPDWSHKRIDEELAKTDERIAKRKAAGKAGAEARYGKRITKPSPEHRQRHGQPHSQPPSDSDATHRDARLDFDEIENRLRSAAGLSEASATGLKDLSPIFALIDKGYDLDKDIVPKLRAANAAGKRPSSWRYYVKGIEETKAANAAIRPKAGGVIVAPVMWIVREDRRWPDLAERYRREHGRDPPTTAGQGGAGRHWPKDWIDKGVDNSPKQTEAEA